MIRLMKDKMIISLIIGILLGSGIVVLFQFLLPHPHPPIPHNATLSPKQLELMKAIQKNQMSEIHHYLKKIKQLHNNLDNEFLKKNPNEENIQKIIIQINQSHFDLSNQHFIGLLNTRKILKEEQFKQMVREHKKDPKNVKAPRQNDMPHLPFGPGNPRQPHKAFN